MKRSLFLLLCIATLATATAQSFYPGAPYGGNVSAGSVQGPFRMLSLDTVLPTIQSAIITRTGQIIPGGIVPSAAWNLGGNSGTSSINNFLGTTDNTALTFRTNNTARATITNKGYFGIGVSSPTNTFQSVGTVNESFTGPSGILYYLTMSDTIPGVPYTIPHLGLFAGPALGMHSLIENEDNTVFGTRPRLFTVMGVVDNSGSTKFTVSCDTEVDIHTQDTFNTFNAHFHFGSGGMYFATGGEPFSGPIVELSLDNDSNALAVTGTLRLNDGNTAQGNIWTSNANGYGSWQVNTPILDSVTLYSMTPPEGQTYICSDCTGFLYCATCTQRVGNVLVTRVGALWKRDN